jgi:hypothetical protein
MSPNREKETPYFEEFDAVQLYCPTCRQASQVRKRLLLVLQDGDLYEYRCARCNTFVGKKKGDSTMSGLPEA